MLTYEQTKAIETALGPDKAAPILEAFQTSDQRVMTALLNEIATKTDLANERAATREDIHALHTELKQDIADLRTEVKQDIADLRAELKGDMASLRTELKGDMADLRTELKGDIASLEARMIRLETLLKVLIGLAALAVAFFSPVAEKLLSLL